MRARAFCRAVGVVAALLLGARAAHADAVMDTDDNAAAFTGTWTTSTATILFYGDNYQVAQGGGMSDTATFRAPTMIDVTGQWCIYARWTAFPNRFSNVRFEVYDGIIGAMGTTLGGTFFVNQQQNGGAWRRLGCVPLTSGRFSEVQLSDFGAVAGQFVIADGVRWVREQVGAANIVDEPGQDFADQSSREIGGATPIDACNPSTFPGLPIFTTLTTVTLTVPANGRVVVRASGQVALTVASKYVRLGIDDVSGGFMLDTNTWTAAVPVGSTDSPENRRSFAVQQVYVVTPGTRTFFLKACREVGTLFPPDLPSADGTIFWDDFIAEYVPTMY